MCFSLVFDSLYFHAVKYTIKSVGTAIAKRMTKITIIKWSCCCAIAPLGLNNAMFFPKTKYLISKNKSVSAININRASHPEWSFFLRIFTMKNNLSQNNHNHHIYYNMTLTSLVQIWGQLLKARIVKCSRTIKSAEVTS